MNANRNFHYPLFHELPQSLKVLYTMILLILGLGYVFAMIQIYEVHAGRDGKPGISVADIEIAYRGSEGGTRLEAALLGPMASMLPEEEAASIIGWIHAGAQQASFAAQVQPILELRCHGCHGGANPHIPTLLSYQEVKALTVLDTGVSIGTLVRVSHIHLFGLTFIFGFLGLIFSHAHWRRAHVKSIIVAVPFVAIFIDIASWWLTKVSGGFAYAVVIGGALMGVSFAIQWLVSMYQMWFAQRPDDERSIAQ
ncbi:MAG: hypothetical protein AB1810_16160 [Pseudomonadota bacterium]